MAALRSTAGIGFLSGGPRGDRARSPFQLSIHPSGSSLLPRPLFSEALVLARIIRFRSADDEGATAVEYGLMVALIAAVIAGAVGTLGGQVNTAFQHIVTALTPASGG
jgi:pilus assembly protein Flp/PilA